MTDFDSAARTFHAGSVSSVDECLRPDDWTDEEWKRLFRFTSSRKLPAGDALIRRGEADRNLYFVLRGRLEVVVRSSDGHSMAPLSRVGPGSVLGEQSFFDGNPRSASAWAVDDCEVAAMSPDQFAALEQSHPDQARALLFALGRLIASRLRRATEKAFG